MDVEALKALLPGFDVSVERMTMLEYALRRNSQPPPDALDNMVTIISVQRKMWRIESGRPELFYQQTIFFDERCFNDMPAENIAARIVNNLYRKYINLLLK